jgi:hypothetical protein
VHAILESGGWLKKRKQQVIAFITGNQVLTDIERDRDPSMTHVDPLAFPILDPDRSILDRGTRRRPRIRLLWATTMAVVPVRGTKRCHAVAEAAVPVLAAAEVLTDGPATSMEVPQSEQKAKASDGRESILFLPFSVLISLAYSLGAE